MAEERSYLEEIQIARRSLFSTVIAVITDDSRRVKELRAFLERNPLGNKKEDEMLVYDFWEGLVKFKDGKYEPIKPESDSPYAGLLGGDQSSRMPLAQALRVADKALKTKCIKFVIQNIMKQEEVLNLALLTWASNEGLLTRESSIVLILPNKLLIPSMVLDQIRVIVPPSSTKQERKQVISEMKEACLNDMATMNNESGGQMADQIKSMKDTSIDELVDITGGLNLNQLESAVTESILRRGYISTTEVGLTKARLLSARDVLAVEMNPAGGFEGVGGYDTLKDFIRQSLIEPYKNRKLAITLGIGFPRGIILFGNPGTGKTLIAKAVAKECGLPFVYLRTENIKRSFVGESEERMGRALRAISEMSPCIVFIDELDRLGKRSDVSTDSGVGRELFSQFLEWLGDEKRESIVIGTTNIPESLDEAFRRVGRFDYLVPVMLPDREARKQILEVHTKVKAHIPLAPDVDFDEVARKTNYWNGAEVHELVERAKRKAFLDRSEVVTMKHIMDALDTFSVNREMRRDEHYKFFRLAKMLCNDAQFMERVANVVTEEDETELNRLFPNGSKELMLDSWESDFLRLFQAKVDRRQLDALIIALRPVLNARVNHREPVMAENEVLDDFLMFKDSIVGMPNFVAALVFHTLITRFLRRDMDESHLAPLVEAKYSQRFLDIYKKILLEKQKPFSRDVAETMDQMARGNLK
jgi:ATP-dependent 26S proteasome regulatory subunit